MSIYLAFVLVLKVNGCIVENGNWDYQNEAKRIFKTKLGSGNLSDDG